MRGTQRIEYRSALDPGGGQVPARPAGRRPVRVRAQACRTRRRRRGRSLPPTPAGETPPLLGKGRTGTPARQPVHRRRRRCWRQIGQRRDAPPWRLGAIAVAVAVPGAGELEADPGLADDGHEPDARSVAVRAQAWLEKRGAVDPVLDLPRVRWSGGAVEADVVAAQAGCVAGFTVLPPFPTVGHDAWRSASILDVCFGLLNSGRSRALGDQHVPAGKHPIAGRVTPARQPVACG